MTFYIHKADFRYVIVVIFKVFQNLNKLSDAVSVFSNFLRDLLLLEVHFRFSKPISRINSINFNSYCTIKQFSLANVTIIHLYVTAACISHYILATELYTIITAASRKTMLKMVFVFSKQTRKRQAACNMLRHKVKLQWRDLP
jgi:hypothetical protein